MDPCNEINGKYIDFVILTMNLKEFDAERLTAPTIIKI